MQVQRVPFSQPKIAVCPNTAVILPLIKIRPTCRHIFVSRQRQENANLPLWEGVEGDLSIGRGSCAP